MKMRNLTFLFSFLLCLSTNSLANEPQEQPQKPEVKKLILPGESFLVADRPAFILWPDPSQRKERVQPWVFYAPTLAGYPDDHEKWMHQQFLSAGVAVAGIDVGEAYGSPASRKLFDTFYELMIEKKGLATKPCLLGRSRGGLWVCSWACDYPERFSGLAGIYPVFDLKTYPGIDKAATAYGLTSSDLEMQLSTYNPIQRVAALGNAKLPVFIIHGDEDSVVPLKENSQALLDAYRKAGNESSMTLEVVKGQGHNHWEGFFHCQALVDFVIAKAKGN